MMLCWLSFTLVMKFFLAKSLTFVGISFLSIICILFFSAKLIDKKAKFKIKPDTRYLVFGPSLPECAFNDSLISNFQNFAQSGESYFYTYFKLKKLIEQNNKVDVVFVEIINHQKQDNRDVAIWGDKYISNRLSIYFPFMSYNDYKVLYLHNSSGFINGISLYLKDNLKRCLKRNLNYSNHIGGYQYLVRDKTDSILKNLIAPKSDVPQGYGSDYSNIYLKKIILFCKEKNKKVFLIRSPIHPNSKELKNEENFKYTLEHNFPGIQFLDFKKFPLLNSEFGDLEH